MLNAPFKVKKDLNAPQNDEKFVSDKWSMAFRSNRVMTKETENLKKKMGLGGFQSFEVTMAELRHQYMNDNNAIQYAVLTTIGRGKLSRIKNMTQGIEYPQEEQH